MAFAETQHLLGEHAVALAGFDDVLRSEPTHRDAWLGRVTSLSHLGRHHDAIAAASRLLELGVWHVGDAHYWRAWNRYHVYELDRAWADVEQATRLMVNTSVYTLAGVIAYARRELATSIDRLDHALQLDAGNCDAAWTAGLVHVDQEAWARAGDRFSHAMRCLTMAAAEARRDITALDATGDTPVTRRRRAAAQKRAEGSEHRAAQSAFNAAQSFLRLGQKDRALAHLSEAAAHPLLKEKAVALRQSIEKVP
jgi:tetratricopeptide (TPR) repeat protein